MDVDIVARITRNPYVGMLSAGSLRMFLGTAVTDAAQQFGQWAEEGLIGSGRDSYGGVILDPTVPLGAPVAFADRVMGIVGIGPYWEDYVPNGAGKADVHDYTGLPNGSVLDEYPHLLRSGAFVYGGSIEYKRVVAAGSGLSVEQDQELMMSILAPFVDKTDAAIVQRIRESKQLGRRWLNGDGVTPLAYRSVLALAELED